MRSIVRPVAAIAALLAVAMGGFAGPAAGSTLVEPLLSVTPGPLGFGDVRVGAVSVHQQVTVVNDRSPDPLAYRLVVPSGFTAVPVTPGCTPDPVTKLVTLAPAPSPSCAYAVRFAPTAAVAATYAKDLLVDVAGSGRDSRVALRGTSLVDPALATAPASLDFGDVRVGTTSVFQRFTVTNDLVQDEVVGPVNVLAFKFVAPSRVFVAPLDARCAPDPVTKLVTLQPAGGPPDAASGSCTYAIRYAPTLAGALAKDLVIDVQGAGRDPRIALQAAAVGGPVLPVTPASLDFGDVRVGTSSTFQQFTVTNDLLQDEELGPLNVVTYKLVVPSRYPLRVLDPRCAPDPVTKLVTLHPAGGPPDVASGSCTYALRYAPTVAGPVAQAVVIDVQGGGLDPRVALTANALAEPVLPASPGTLAFGDVLVGRTSDPQTLVVTNDLVQDEVLGPLNVVTYKLSVPSAFSVAAQDPRCAPDPVTKLVTLHPVGGPPDVASGSCAYDLRFVPRLAGSLAVDIVVDVPAPGRDTRVPVTASGVFRSVLAVSPASLDFPDASGVGQALTLTNVGNERLYLFALASSPPFYLAPGTCGPTLKLLSSLAPGASCTMTVWFWPTTTGSSSWTLDLAGTAQTVSVPMTGRSG